MSADDSDSEYKFQIDEETGEVTERERTPTKAKQQGESRYLLVALLEFGIFVLFTVDAVQLGPDGFAAEPLWATFLTSVAVVALVGSLDSVARYLYGTSIVGALR